MEVSIEAKPIAWARFVQFFDELKKNAQEDGTVSIKVFVKDENITVSANVGNNYSVLGMKKN
jgi:hypothetical protein